MPTSNQKKKKKQPTGLSWRRSWLCSKSVFGIAVAVVVVVWKKLFYKKYF